MRGVVVAWFCLIEPDAARTCGVRSCRCRGSTPADEDRPVRRSGYRLLERPLRVRPTWSGQLSIPVFPWAEKVPGICSADNKHHRIEATSHRGGWPMYPCPTGSYRRSLFFCLLRMCPGLSVFTRPAVLFLHFPPARISPFLPDLSSTTDEPPAQSPQSSQQKKATLQDQSKLDLIRLRVGRICQSHQAASRRQRRFSFLCREADQHGIAE